ncbi:transporter [Sulfolobus tengchongensis]|uniref:Transporter n=1 Tax=Sulfolobus tengchongensis TaxID=207809 RepID=A0AAX4L2B9_9CREN
MPIRLRSFILPIFSYAIPTFVLVYPSFFVNWLSKTMNLAYWEVFAIVALPFLGRIMGSFLYQSLKFNAVAYCFPLLGLLVILQNFLDLNILAIVRFFVGVLFGLLTSYAVESAVNSGNSALVGLTTAGWSIGWVMGYFAFAFLKDWYDITIVGFIIMLLSLLGLDNNEDFKWVKRSFISLPKLSSILIYISALSPAFVLQIIPSIFEGLGLAWLILPSYLLSIPVYVFLPVIGEFFGIRRVLVLSSVIVLISCLLMFLYFPWMVLIFTSFGLGVLGLAPKYLVSRGEDSRKVGLALNIGSIMGLIIPTLYGVMPMSPELLLSALMIAMVIV